MDPHFSRVGWANTPRTCRAQSTAPDRAPLQRLVVDHDPAAAGRHFAPSAGFALCEIRTTLGKRGETGNRMWTCSLFLLSRNGVAASSRGQHVHRTVRKVRTPALISIAACTASEVACRHWHMIRGQVCALTLVVTCSDFVACGRLFEYGEFSDYNNQGHWGNNSEPPAPRQFAASGRSVSFSDRC